MLPPVPWSLGDGSDEQVSSNAGLRIGEICGDLGKTTWNLCIQMGSV